MGTINLIDSVPRETSVTYKYIVMFHVKQKGLVQSNSNGLITNAL